MASDRVGITSIFLLRPTNYSAFRRNILLIIINNFFLLLLFLCMFYLQRNHVYNKLSSCKPFVFVSLEYGRWRIRKSSHFMQYITYTKDCSKDFLITSPKLHDAHILYAHNFSSCFHLVPIQLWLVHKHGRNPCNECISAQNLNVR